MVLAQFVPILTVSQVPNLPAYHPNLTGEENVPTIEQCHISDAVKLAADYVHFIREKQADPQPT